MRLNRHILSLKKNKAFLFGFIKEKLFVPSLLKNIIILSFLKSILFKKKIVVINLIEHIGDMVACEPVSRIIRKKYKDDFIIWVTKYRYKDVVKCNPFIDLVMGTTCLFECMVLRNLRIFDEVVDLHIDQRRCTSFGSYFHNPNKHGITLENYYFFGSILEVFSLAGGLEKISEQPIFHFCKNTAAPKVPGKYIVIHCRSNEDSRDWDPDKFDQIVREVSKKGVFIVEIGLKSTIRETNPFFIDMCGKLNIQEYALLIKRAELFLGIDSSFAHIANAVGTYGIILLGHYRAFKKYMPYTGDYANNKNALIIYHDGLCKDILFNTVYSEVRQKLKI